MRVGYMKYYIILCKGFEQPRILASEEVPGSNSPGIKRKKCIKFKTTQYIRCINYLVRSFKKKHFAVINLNGNTYFDNCFLKYFAYLSIASAFLRISLNHS